jgi:hypothetical protein
LAAIIGAFVFWAWAIAFLVLGTLLWWWGGQALPKNAAVEQLVKEAHEMIDLKMGVRLRPPDGATAPNFGARLVTATASAQLATAAPADLYVAATPAGRPWRPM